MTGTATRRDPGQDRRFRDLALSGWTPVAQDGRGGHRGLNDSAAGPAGVGAAS
jgi:hypothetical protein